MEVDSEAKEGAKKRHVAAWPVVEGLAA